MADLICHMVGSTMMRLPYGVPGRRYDTIGGNSRHIVWLCTSLDDLEKGWRKCGRKKSLTPEEGKWQGLQADVGSSTYRQMVDTDLLPHRMNVLKNRV